MRWFSKSLYEVISSNKQSLVTSSRKKVIVKKVVVKKVVVKKVVVKKVFVKKLVAK